MSTNEPEVAKPAAPLVQSETLLQPLGRALIIALPRRSPAPTCPDAQPAPRSESHSS